ncbi:MAG: hypothetical protein GXY07_09470 [Candidatus Hydrogenedentes bacterium]|nr:hypothetical protein [Candidatus Hydrogenedentota bacterium]
MSDILFIQHKTNMMYPEIIPMSLPAIINRVHKRFPVRGAFLGGISEKDIRCAKILILSIHWYVGMKGAIRVADWAKQVNPDISIIAGGMSASVFYPFLLRDSRIDYIIRGDGDIPLLLLVEALLEGKDISDIPNVVGRDFVSKNWQATDQETLDSGNYRTLDWFPTLEQRIRRMHARYNGKILPIHPLLATYRGCPMPCDSCCGGADIHKAIFRRGPLLRGAGPVAADLEAYGNDPGYNFVSIYHDFASLAEVSYTECVLHKTYDLDVYYELTRLPSPAMLRLITNAFRGGTIAFSLDVRHMTSCALVNIPALIESIKVVAATGRFEPRLCYLKQGLTNNKVYRDAFETVRQAAPCSLYCSDWWWEAENPLPDSEGACAENLYTACMANSDRYRVWNYLFRLSYLMNYHAPTLNHTLLKIFRFAYGGVK